MKSMRVAEIAAGDAGFEIRAASRPLPSPSEGEVLLKVHAAGVNGHDLHQLHQGGHAIAQGESDLPGLEVSGVVVGLGEGVERWKIGDPVCALLRGGGYAEFATAPAATCLPVPDGWSFSQAACLPEALFTVWSNVVVDAALPANGSVLINGGSSGIGLVAIQLLSALGAHVLATARGEDKLALCRKLGAAVVIDNGELPFAPHVLKETGNSGVQVILDIIGQATMKDCIDALATGGRLQMISAVSGFDASIDLFTLLRKQLRVAGTLLRPRHPAYKAEVARALEERVWPLLETNRITPVIDSELPLADAAIALARMESKEHLGKILILPDC